MNPDNLYVATAFVDQGPTLKRIHPRSRGQAFKILKRTSHVTIVVKENNQKEGIDLGQKVNPHGMRLGIVKTWDAKWYAGKDFAANLHEDIKIRSFLKETLKVAGVSKIETERSKIVSD